VLPPELAALLDAQREATEDLPYDLLGVRKPKLVQVYVRQAVRQSEGEPSAVERVMSVDEALNGHDHLVITGEPGAGKSTVGHFYVKAICDSWRDGLPNPLRERVLPLRIPARSLAVAESWSAALASGAREALGTLLDVTPTPELFASRQEGVRWLVFVDGLDEIADTATRTRVARSIARQVRGGGDCRIVVTTRQPADSSLEPLHEAKLAFCAIQPFGREELVEFAQAWFRAQDPRTATERAGDFIRQTSDGRLRELVRNPLLATIAAITHTRAPDRPLPANRVDLYDGFVKALLDGAGRNVQAQLRRVLVDRPGRLALVQWLGEHRSELIGHLATRRLESEEGLFPSACEWLVGRTGELPEGWRDDLRTVLDDSGLFVRAGDDWKFLHHSFAEFLAARERAARIPGDFPGLARRLPRVFSESNRTSALFTLALWGRRHGLGPVVRALLNGGADHVLLAASLLAEGGEVPEPLADETVDRVFGLVLAGVEESGALLASMAVPEPVVTRLHELVDMAEVSLVARIECAIALGGLAGARFGASRLESLVEEADEADLARLVNGLAALVPDGDRLERLLLRMAEPGTPRFLTCLELLLDHRRTEAAARLVRDGAKASPDLWQHGLFVILARRAGCGDESVQESDWAMASEWDGKDFGWDSDPDHEFDRVQHARQVFESGEWEPYEFAEGARVLLTASAEDARRVIDVALSRPYVIDSRLLRHVHEAGYRSQTVELARALCVDLPLTGWEECVHELVDLGEPEVAIEVLAAAEASVERDLDRLCGLARAHNLLGDHGSAIASAREALRLNPIRAVDAWLDVGGAPAEAVAEVLASSGNSDARFDVAAGFAGRGLHRQAVELWCDVLVRPDEDQALAAARKLAGCGQRTAATGSLRAALASSPPHRNRLRALLGWVVLISPDADAQELLTHLRP
jgi:tetratricopeptide (TPR) repeat protein